ncbi:MAG TPA: carboxypeptidase-like regulatory domain-containing protein [Candidatus Acidoferrales bacterium]|jgi:hypothetical protein|nr:carboxypeptidase-like regulatory domain-containing protein [Candidatus Acidoferrales bacterium]
MFGTKAKNAVAWLVLVLGMVCLTAPSAWAATNPFKLSGVIAGVVTDASGIPQMGASVTLYSRQERLFERSLTDERGTFKFIGLFPDLYSIKVTLATFVPALKKNILVQPGMRSMLNVNLSTLFSNIQFAYPPLENGSLMSDEWKWVLRSASPMRPVLRFAGDALGGDALAKDTKDTTASNHQRSSVFSDTRGILKVSAGDGPLVTGIGNEADMGTAFALATSLYGNNMLQVSGNVGYGAQTGVPTASFRTSYSRSFGGANPEVSVTMRQLFLPGRVASGLGGSDSQLPMLRSMAASLDDRTQLTDELSLQYGFTLNSVTFLDHVNYASPYVRMAYDLGDGALIEFAYTSGDARPDLAGADRQDADLQRDLNSLGLFPRVSLLAARPKIQRGQEFEMAYTRKLGSRTVQASVYRESVTNAALSIVAPAGFYANGDILPDLLTGTSTFNAGNYQSTGYTGSLTQNLGDHASAMVIFGSMGALTADNRELVSDSPDELRAMIHAGRKSAATARFNATSPWTGTHMIASYQWTDNNRWAMPGHLYSTQAVRPMPGLNLYIKQPIPRFASLPWRMEATADLRNLLAQGYLPLGMAGGQQVLLVQTPRSFRGGLSFIF